MSITPGPNNVICLALGSSYGYKIASKYILGVVIGCISMQWIFLGLDKILTTYLPIITKYISYFGIVYMLYLAYKIATTNNTFDSKDLPKPLGLKTGTLLQYINPKAYIFNATIVTVYLTNMSLNLLQYILLTCITGIIFFLCCSTWAFFGLSFTKVLAKYGKLLNYALSLSLIYLALSILFH